MSTCPRGLINDPYPGSCSQYVDVNQDQLCDLSQVTTSDSSPPPVTDSVPPSMSFDYTLIILFFIPIFIYFFTSKFKLFWNVILLITFIPTVISSLFYVFNIFNPTINQLHLYFGTAFLSISFCHVIWHLPYWQGIIKKIFLGV